MKEFCEVTWQDTEGDEPVTMKEQYYLLHWGMKFQIINEIGVNYTVAICQNCKTGDVMCFNPEQLRILGTQIKK